MTDAKVVIPRYGHYVKLASTLCVLPGGLVATHWASKWLFNTSEWRYRDYIHIFYSLGDIVTYFAILLHVMCYYRVCPSTLFIKLSFYCHFPISAALSCPPKSMGMFWASSPEPIIFPRRWQRPQTPSTGDWSLRPTLVLYHSSLRLKKSLGHQSQSLVLAHGQSSSGAINIPVIS